MTRGDSHVVCGSEKGEEVRRVLFRDKRCRGHLLLGPCEWEGSPQIVRAQQRCKFREDLKTCCMWKVERVEI